MSIPETEQKKLFALSGNRCAYPDCRKVLVASASFGGQPVVLGEVAHIVGESERGPRGQSPLRLVERNLYANLILLCSRHHQLVDAEPARYTVELLYRYRDEHEAWVQKRLGPVDQDAAPAPLVRDSIYSTLLPIDRMPQCIFASPCGLSEAEISAKTGKLRAGEMAPFVLRDGKLIAFQDLSDLDNPFAVMANPLEAERIDPRIWWNDPDKSRWYVDLLNRTLNKLTGRRELHLDRQHHRYYFAQVKPGEEREVVYRPLNQQSTTRQVVWQPKRRSTGEPRPHWFHRAISLRFIRTGAESWVLAMRPELRVTQDGEKSLEAQRIGARVTKKKARWFNYDLLGEVQFWRDYLGDSRPRIVLNFGSVGQQLVISMNMLSCGVDWPGIPQEYVKAFKNVEYVDTLFSWAELQGEPEPSFAHLDDAEDDGEELDDDF